MRAVIVLSFISLLGAVPTAFAQPKDGPARAAEPSAEELITKEIGSLDIGNRHLRLWASTRNPNLQPEQWQFRFDPLFLPEVSADGKVKFSGPTAIGNGWEVSFNLLLNREDVNALALERLRVLYPADAAKINPGNVFARPILWLRMIPKGSFRDAFPSARLARPFWNMARPASEVRVSLLSETREEADAIVASPERLDLDFDYALIAASTTVNSARVTSKQLNNSELVAKLDGLGKPEVYVRRFDARRLLDDLRASVVGEALLENPEAFNDEILRELTAKHFERLRATEESFNAEKWKSTYHGNDLKPDELTKSLRKLYTYDEKTMKWAASGSVDTSAKASLVDILGAEAAFKASFAADDFKKFLAQRNIEVDLAGNIIVVKSVDVYRVNLSELKSTFDTTTKWTEVRPPQLSRFDESVNVGSIAKEATVALAQSNAALTRKEMETSQSLAQAGKTAYEGTQWVSEEGKKIAGEAATEFAAATAAFRSGAEEMARNNYAPAIQKFREARTKFETAQAKYADGRSRIEPERFVNLYAYVKTSDDNKECGSWQIRVMQGNAEIFKDSWGRGQNWDNGSEMPAANERNKPLTAAVNGEKLVVSSSIEEHDGEVRIDWNIDTMNIVLKTNRGREITFERKGFTHKSRGNGGSLKTLDVPAK